jgi:predicted nucleotidyltransferase
MTANAFNEIAARHGVSLIVQFGSTVSGHTHDRSDLDVGVLFDEPGASFDRLAQLTHDLGGVAPGRRVDLAILNYADPLFLYQVTSRCRLLAGNPQRLARLKMYAFRRFQDHRKYLALERAYVKRAVGSATP